MAPAHGAQPDAHVRRRERSHLLGGHARAARELGFNTAIAEIPAPYDDETLVRFIGEVKPLVDRG